MAKRFDVSVTVDGRRLIVELPEGLFLELGQAVSHSSGMGKASLEALPMRLGKADKLSEKELVAQKQPKGHGETVAVLAFCLREAGTLEFTAADMRRAYIRAGVSPPKVVAQALRDAKNKYDLIESGTKRSTFRLSPHGERTVLFDLPRSK
jgi:hypothetical protein